MKGLRYITSEKQLEDVRCLLSDYFALQLDKAIDRVETEKGYTAAIYQARATQNNNSNLMDND